MEQVPVKIPSFHIVNVFDVSDTEGKPLPELDIHPLTGDVTQYDTLMEAIRRTAKVPVSIEPVSGDANGYFDQEKIVIREGLSELQTIKTAIHELAHSRHHSIAETDQKNLHKDQATREIEAESIAFVVCEHFGLDTADYSFGYLGSWSSNKELPELKASCRLSVTVHFRLSMNWNFTWMKSRKNMKRPIWKIRFGKQQRKSIWIGSRTAVSPIRRIRRTL